MDRVSYLYAPRTGDQSALPAGRSAELRSAVAMAVLYIGIALNVAVPVAMVWLLLWVIGFS